MSEPAASTAVKAGAPAPADGDKSDDEEEGFGSNAGLLAESVTKDEWKSIEAALTYNKKTVAEMLKRACGQVRHKGEILIDDTNGKFLGDMLPEMETFSAWCYKEHIRPKLLSLPLTLPDEDEGDKKKKGGGGGGKKGGGGGKKGKEEKIPAKTQIKIDNVMRIMNGESAKDKGKKGAQVGDKATGWLEALEGGRNLVVDAPWELQLAKEMGNAAALLNRKKGEGEKDTEESRYRSVRARHRSALGPEANRPSPDPDRSARA